MDVAPAPGAGPQPIILLVNPAAKRGSGSIAMRQSGGGLYGGMTIKNLAAEPM